MKKKMMKTLLVLSLASTAMIFAGCGKKVKPDPTPVDDEVKYDKNLKMKYKEFNGEAEIVEIEKQGETLTIPNTIGDNGAKVTRISCTYADDKDLKKVVISDNLIYFNGNGFMNCSNLEEVEFGSNPQITAIPSKAFLGTKLSSITIPASVKSISYEAFQNVETLTTVTIASGSVLDTIGPFAFYNCNKIEAIYLPETLTNISDSAFEKCSSLTTVTFDNAKNLTSIDQSAFSGCVGITSLDFSSNSKLTKIGSNAFRGCTELSSITFNDGLKEIGVKAFYNTQKTTSVSLPASLTSIGDEAFVNTGLTSLELKSGSDIQIGNNAFTQYDKVLVDKDYKEGEPFEYILVPKESIVSVTLNGNLSLTQVFTDYVPQVRQSLKTAHITGDKIAANSFKGCTLLTNLVIDDTVKAMGESAFENCTGITAAALNNGLKEVSKNTFKGCTSLVTVTLPATVEIVGEGAFDGCIAMNNLVLSNLTEIGSFAFRNTLIETPTFSSKIKLIGESAFENCLNIEEVNIVTDADVKTNIGKNAFANCTNITVIKLSAGSVLQENAFINDTNVVTLETKGEYGLATLFGSSIEAAASSIETLTIIAGSKAIEDYAFRGCTLVEEINIPNTVKSIGEEAFRGCRTITTLDLQSVTTIGNYAFADCDKLALTTLPDTVTEINEGLFLNDSSISNFTIKDGVTKIGASAFEGCSNLVLTNSNLELIELSDSITYIGTNAFKGCVKISFSKLPTELKELGSYAFSGCLNVKISKTNDKLEKIGDYAFSGCQAITSFEFANDLSVNNKLGMAVLYGCTQITSLTVYGTSSLEYLFGKDSVKYLQSTLSSITIKGEEVELADYMFYGFTAISKVELEKDDQDRYIGLITKIGDYAFSGCISLKNIDISKVVEIGDHAFDGSGLEKITIPSTGIVLGEYVFANCTSLSSLTFEDAVTDDSLNIKTIPNGTFMNTILVSFTLPDTVEEIGSQAFNSIYTLDSITISQLSRLTAIGDEAFTNCANLRKIFIPKNVEAMGDSVFANCIALKDVEFASANKIEYIQNYAFSNCYALTSINLPNSIRQIRKAAFQNCSCLTEVQLPTSLEELYEGAFQGARSINNLVIPKKIEAIPDNAFMDCDMLELIDWSVNDGNVKTIGKQAFYNSSYKTEIPGSVNYIGESAFSNGNNGGTEADKYPRTFAGGIYVWKEVEDEEPGTYVYKYVLVLDTDTTNYKGVELGTSDTGVGLVIDKNAFKTSALASVKLGSKITEMGISVFAKSYVRTANLNELKITLIAESMFDSCDSLTNVNLTNNTTVNTIGPKAFFEAKALTSFNFNNILSIGDSAFQGCEALFALPREDGEIIVPADLGPYTLSLGTGNNNVSIGKKAFFDSGVGIIILGKKVISLGDEAFSHSANAQVKSGLVSADLSGLDITEISAKFFANCSNLKTVSINIAKIRTIGANAFENTAITSLAFLKDNDHEQNDPEFVETVLEKIEAQAFMGCVSLSSAVIPNSVTKVGNSAFEDCSKLIEVTWSTKCNVINDKTFNGSGLTNFTIPENVNRIGEMAFAATSPTILIFNSLTPPSVDPGFVAENNASKVTIKVPKAKVGDAYVAGKTEERYLANNGFRVTVANGATIVEYEPAS